MNKKNLLVALFAMAVTTQESPLQGSWFWGSKSDIKGTDAEFVTRMKAKKYTTPVANHVSKCEYLNMLDVQNEELLADSAVGQANRVGKDIVQEAEDVRFPCNKFNREQRAQWKKNIESLRESSECGDMRAEEREQRERMMYEKWEQRDREREERRRNEQREFEQLHREWEERRKDRQREWEQQDREREHQYRKAQERTSDRQREFEQQEKQYQDNFRGNQQGNQQRESDYQDEEPQYTRPRATESQLTQAYQLLGLQSGVTQAKIKKSYYALARERHPDMNPGDTTATARFQELQNAYDLIIDSL